MATGEEPMSMAPWSSGLPAGIPTAVLGRLPSHTDRVRFAAVCRPWRAAARHQQSPPPLPWLALSDGTFFSFPGSSAFRLLGAARYHGSCAGLLARLRTRRQRGRRWVPAPEPVLRRHHAAPEPVVRPPRRRAGTLRESHAGHHG
ncbi:hypothetical protein GQ55_3G156900 [Panicum hallii var. hallii]|uniref:F-box domain-containing protein n=1 Tax=Panicum hallii var. hallii TaxID=1504633 RepID=A0A2T7E9W0_9POAL|nr:hypothetical protein GQ55_3G156900 [Panicum hallii var. hallii]